MDITSLTITSTSSHKLINNRFKVLRRIGQGQYGKVLLGQQVLPPYEFVAIKTINRIDKTKLITKTYLNHTTKIKREIQIMKQCNHPNVVRLDSVIDDLKFDKILLVLEYCEGGEIDWKNYNHYNEKRKGGLTLNKVLRDVVNGLEYLHEFKGIIHRDLKPSNLLIHNNNIKISDFGVSLILENNANDDRELGKTVGTPAFFAPELCQFVNNRLSMLDTKSNIDKRIDLWSLGVILYCMMFHELPFNGKNEFGLFKRIVNSPLKIPRVKQFSEFDRKEFELLVDLIEHLLVKEPNERYTIVDIKNHGFTTFDLNLSDSLKFKRMNDEIINEQIGLSGKIKRFFGGKVVDVVSPIKVELPVIGDMEGVDDLLDSYFDSSSMGSLETMDEDTVEDDTLNETDNNLNHVDTANILGSKTDLLEPHKIHRPPPLQLNVHTGSPLKHAPFLEFQAPKVPLDPVLTPLSASSSISIGPNTPYSPTRSFFDKINLSYNIGQNYTISNLASPPTTKTKAFDLEPPGMFKTRDSQFGAPLKRITSSSSSLNLHAYLTETDQKRPSMTDYLDGLE